MSCVRISRQSQVGILNRRLASLNAIKCTAENGDRMFDDKMVAHFSTVKQHFDRQMANSINLISIKVGDFCSQCKLCLIFIFILIFSGSIASLAGVLTMEEHGSRVNIRRLLAGLLSQPGTSNKRRPGCVGSLASRHRQPG